MKRARVRAIGPCQQRDRGGENEMGQGYGKSSRGAENSRGERKNLNGGTFGTLLKGSSLGSRGKRGGGT